MALQKRQFPEATVQFYGAELLLAIAYAQSMGAVCNVTDESLQLDHEGHLVVSASTTGQVSLPTEFMAPEVLRGDDCGHATTMWAVGCLYVRAMQQFGENLTDAHA